MGAAEDSNIFLQDLLFVSINGIQALTTKSLAEYIGISEPALYRHFKNKSEIIRAMLMQFDVDLESLRRKHSGWELV
ncbi:MAG: helix-turn-helix transcriptional regulator, partial [Lentisphaeria bacterium]|nr:helix-turn-helix transcriptional regulator [Lentisphaeria bacterium]